MILSFSFQFKTLILSILVGFSMGFAYDWIRVFRRIIFHKNFFVQIEDIIYWVFMSVVVFLIALYQNNGEVRAFFVIGIILGMYTYFLTISKLFINVSTSILRLIKKIFLFLLNCVFMPFKILFNIIYPIFKPLINLSKKYLIKLAKIFKKLLQNNKKYVKIYSKISYKNLLKIKKMGEDNERKNKKK